MGVTHMILLASLCCSDQSKVPSSSSSNFDLILFVMLCVEAGWIFCRGGDILQLTFKKQKSRKLMMFTQNTLL